MHINRKPQSDSQTALGAQSNAREAKPARRTFAAFGLQRIALACFGVLGTGSLLVLAGCPANLENPERFDQPGASAGGAGPAGGSSTGGASTVVAAPACVTDAFKASCIMCHVAGNPLSAGLDLTGADVANRLVNVSAMHAQADMTMCSPAKLIDPANASASWILAKINGTQGKCGSPMPLTGTALTPAQKTCIAAFVMSEASGSPAPAGAAGATATATGGSGGM